MLKIKEGYAYFYFCFDIAEEIKLEKLEKVLGTTPRQFKLEGKRLSPDYMQYRVPPLFVRLGAIATRFNERTITSILDIKLYDFGAITIRFQVPLKGTLEDLEKFSSLAEEKDIFEKEAKEFLSKLKDELSEYLVKPEKKNDYIETYTIFSVRKFDKKISAKELYNRNWKTIAKIIKQEVERMSDEELKDTVKNPFSYYEDDIVIVDWNGAFIYDTTKSYDVIDVIEYAVIELLELRAYDNYLDKALDQAYDDIEKRKQSWIISPFVGTFNNLLHTQIEVSEVVEKVENSLKLIGDPYLAKVYTIAANRFYLDRWKLSIKNKLEVVERTYEGLSNRINNARMIILELLIVLLFIADLILIYYVGG